MPRKKVVEIAQSDNGEPEQPKGEALPPLEDFVRKMSNTFSETLTYPEVNQVPGEDDEEDDEDGDS